MVTKDFAELFACLNARGVRAIVVGGYAFAFHAKPRFTNDIDVFVEPTPENAASLLQALEDFGFGGLGLTSADFTRPGTVVQLGVPPNRVDLMTAIDGVTFAEAWAGRAQDLADLEALLLDQSGLSDAVRPNTLLPVRRRGWATGLHVRDLCPRSLSKGEGADLGPRRSVMLTARRP